MADNTLDKLIIELEAKGTSGVDAITKLTNSLGNLSKATDKLDASKLSTMTSEISNFSGSAKVADAAIPKLVSGLKELSKQSGNLNTFTFSRLINGIKDLNNVSNPQGLANLTKGLASLTKVTQGTDAGGLERIVNQVQRLKVLDGMDASGVGALASGLAKIGRTDFTKVDTDKLSEVTTLIGDLGDKLSGLPSNTNIDIRINTPNASGKGVGNGSITPQIDGESVKQEAGNVGADVAQTFIEKVNATMANFSLATPFGKIGKVATVAGMAISKGLKAAAPYAQKLAVQFGKLYLNIIKTVAGMAKMGAVKFAKAINPINAIGNAMDRLKSKLGTVARLATFMLLRKAFTALITNARQGIDNLAQYSDAMGTRFNSSMSTLVSDFKWAGNALATAFEPILNVAIPIIDALITRLVAAMSAFANFIAALTGASTFTRAIKINENYAQSLNKNAGAAGNAGKAAKKAAKDTKSYTTAIDELNILEPDKGTSGSGGTGSGAGGVGGLDPTSMFETVETTVKAQNWAQMLKDAWANADFTQIGAIIGQKVKDALDYAHTEIYPKLVDFARRLGSSLATLFNGFIEVDGLGYSIGRGLADAVNVAANFIDSFAWNFHFDSLGRFVMEGIEGALDNLDWTTIHSAAIGVARGIRDFINSAFEDPAIWGKIGTGIGNAINLGIDFAYTVLKGVDFGKIGSDIATTLNNAVSTINWSKLGADLIEGINGLLRVVDGFLETFDFKTFGASLGEGIKTGIQNFDWASLGSSAGNLFSGLVDGLTGLIDGLDLKETVKSLVKGLFTALGNVDWLEVAKSVGGLLLAIGKGIVDVLMGAAEAAWELLTDWVSTLFSDLWEELTKPRDFTGKNDEVKASMLGALGFTNGEFDFSVGVQLVKDGWNTVKGWLDGLTGGKFSKGVGIVREGFTSVAEWIKGKFMGGGVDKNVGLGKTWSSVADWIKSHLGGVVSKTVGLDKTWATVADWIKGRMGGEVKKKVTINAVITGLTQKLKQFFGLYHGGIYTGGRFVGIPSYANGGFVRTRGAQVFMARETGNPELVGQIGSHPAVLNNGQIVSLVSSGVAAAVGESFGKVAVALYKAFSEMQFVAQPIDTFADTAINMGSTLDIADFGTVYTSAVQQTQAIQAATMKAAMLAAMTEFYADYDNGSGDVVEAIKNKDFTATISAREIAQANRRGAKQLGAVIMA